MLGAYPVEDITNCWCDEPLLMSVQRALLRIRRVRAVVGETEFKRNFPHDFKDKQQRYTMIKSSISAAANTLVISGFAPQLTDTMVATMFTIAQTGYTGVLEPGHGILE